MAVSIKNFLAENQNNKELINFIASNHLTSKVIKANFSLFEDYVTSYNLCKKREELDKCQQPIKGYRYKLVLLINQQLKLVLTDCAHRINSLAKKEATNNFLIRHYPDELLSKNWSNDFNSGNTPRQQILVHVEDLLKNKTHKGLYLYGTTNIGKTFIFILLANKLIAKKETVSFISWPQFISEIKNSFNEANSNYLSKIELVKSCQYLFIDDLGGEAISAWERDELLFPILNTRSLAGKTTFINSNYSISELEYCYNLKNNKVEKIKVKRLIDRIQKLTIAIELTNSNK